MDPLILRLPEWTSDFLRKHKETVFPSMELRMQLVLELARANVVHQTGGPFGAAVFEQESGRLLSVGVNRVIPHHCSLAHAEMLAISFAQQALQTYDLGGPTQPAYELVTSSQMCAMCFGAVPWSGVRRVVCGASSQDVERITGFDEGPVPVDSKQQLAKRGIQVIEHVLRPEACQVLKDYVAAGGIVYNAASTCRPRIQPCG